MNVRVAMQLLRQGRSYREVGVVLARRAGSPSPYQAHSVYTSVRQYLIDVGEWPKGKRGRRREQCSGT